MLYYGSVYYTKFDFEKKAKPIFVTINSKCSFCKRQLPLYLRHVKGIAPATRRPGLTNFLFNNHWQLKQVCGVCIAEQKRDFEDFGLKNARKILGSWEIN